MYNDNLPVMRDDIWFSAAGSGTVQNSEIRSHDPVFHRRYVLVPIGLNIWQHLSESLRASATTVSMLHT